VKLRDDAVLYAETQKVLGVVDPLSGETPADKELRITSAKWDASKNALKEIVANGWSRPAAPGTGTSKRKARTNGSNTRRVS
jgi:hypothetical protein